MEAEQLKPYNLKILSFSEKGIRVKNDDKIYFEKIQNDSYLFIIADGMGGYDNGEAAAKTAIEIISKRIIENKDIITEESINRFFEEAHAEINKIYDEAGATICGTLIKESMAHIFWSGDVKLFLVDNSNTFSTKDHTLLSLLQETETIIKSEEISRLQNTVTRAIGGKISNYLPEHAHVTISDNFKILMCSDGVHQLYAVNEIFNNLASKDPEDFFNELKIRSKEYSKDNYSAILIYND
ncbi:MAG: serine/threonine-protein phosphatase [Bacteroidetes bacterium]|nr:serine/threonine-protein phosphatase [Bacteroidota bacterium]